jgi:ATP-dependent DNA ligase
MAKRADSMYLSGARADNWLKIKTSKRQEGVIAGFTAPRRTRPFFGALTLALHEGRGWRYIGHVGTGFSHEARMGATHFLTKTLPKVAAEMALSVLAYNLTLMNIIGTKPLMATIAA